MNKDSEYCPFEKICKYAEGIAPPTLSDGIIKKKKENKEEIYRCEALRDDDRCSYLSLINGALFVEKGLVKKIR